MTKFGLTLSGVLFLLLFSGEPRGKSPPILMTKLGFALSGVRFLCFPGNPEENSLLY